MPLYAVYSGAFEEAHPGVSPNARIHVRDAHRTRKLREDYGLKDTNSVPYSCRDCGGVMIVADGSQIPKYFRHLSAECSGGGDESEIHYDLALGLGDVFSNFPEVERVFWDGEYEKITSEGGYIQPDVTIVFKSGIELFVEVVHKHPPEQITIETLGTSMIVVRTDQIPQEDVYSGLAQATIAAEILQYHENLMLLKAGKIHPSQVEISWKPKGIRASFERMDTQYPRFMRQHMVESKCSASYVYFSDKLRKISQTDADFDELLASNKIVWKDKNKPIYEDREITEMREVIETTYEMVEPPPSRFKKLVEKYDNSQYIRDNYQTADTWLKFAELFGMDPDYALTGPGWFNKNIRTKKEKISLNPIIKKQRVKIGSEIVKEPYTKIIEEIPITADISSIDPEKLVDQGRRIECNWEIKIKSRHQGRESRNPTYHKIWNSSFTYLPQTNLIESSIDNLTQEDIDAIGMVLHFKFHQRLGEYLESRMRFSKHISGRLSYVQTPSWGSNRKVSLPFVFIENIDFLNINGFRRYEIARRYVDANSNESGSPANENTSFDVKLDLVRWFRRKDGQITVYSVNHGSRSSTKQHVAEGDYDVFMQESINKWMASAKEVLSKSSPEVNYEFLHDKISMRFNQIFGINQDDIRLVRLG